jgi:hypothetical protein
MQSYQIDFAGLQLGVAFDCDDERDALAVAFETESPMGHSLWCDGRFVGWFEATDLDGLLALSPDHDGD